MAREYELYVPDELLGGVWANALGVDVGDHEITFDFVRLDFSTGSPPEHALLVARVALPPALLERVIRRAEQAIADYSAKVGKESFGGTTEAL